MLGLSVDESAVRDLDELNQASPEIYRSFKEAQALAAEPNNSGLEKAIASFQTIVEIDPRFALAYAELSILYVRRFNADNDRANLSAARNNSKLAVEYNPHSARSILSSALVNLYSGNTAESMRDFDKSMTIDPNNPQALLYKAQAYRYLNQNTKAEAVYRTITDKRPNYWPAYNELGYLLSHDGNHAAAADAFGTAKAVATTVALPQANLGAEYVFLNRLPEAKEECQQSIQKSPTDIAYRTLGDLAFMAGDYQSSKSNYQMATKINPRFHDNWRDLADAEAMLGNHVAVKEDYAKAALVLSDAIPAQSRSKYEWATLAFYFAKTGDTVQAESALRQLGPTDSASLSSQLMAIQALALLARKEDALKMLLRALDNGLTPIQVDFSLDLKELSKDPRYISRVAELRKKRQNAMP
jgi:eukaryotic-like serine/threonine-protein kinase